ncbi:MAG: tRNA lysidine(34) synthetase TilS [Pseudomonadota bacterium]
MLIKNWLTHWQSQGHSAPSPLNFGVALSGGVDSSVLLHWIKHHAPFSSTITAYHVHHGLQTSADAWVHHCETLCKRLEIPLVVHYLDPATRKNAESIEAWARDARYAWLREQPVECMLLGHHQADQAETLMLQLLRGAGIAGLSGMSSLWHAHHKWWARPFLNASKNTLIDYATKHGINWIEDPSNRDETYSRNWLRHTVMPILKARVPSAETALARSAAHCAESWAFIEELIQSDLNLCCPTLDVLALEQLRLLHPYRQKQVLRAFIRRWTGKPPSTDVISQAITAFLEPRDAEKHRPQLQLQTVCFSWWKEAIWAHSTVPPFVSLASLASSLDSIQKTQLNPMQSIHLPTGQLTLYATEEHPPVDVLYTTGHAGAYLQLKTDAPARSLKKLWYNAGVSRWDRAGFPLIVNEAHQPLWAPMYAHFATPQQFAHALFYTGEGVFNENHPHIELRWYPQRPNMFS